VSSTIQQRSDAAHADDLPRHVDEVVPLEQSAAVGLKGVPVLANEVAEPFFEVRFLVDRQEVADGHDERRIACETAPAVDGLGKLGQRLHAVAGTRPREELVQGLQPFEIEEWPERVEDVGGVQSAVPDVDVAHASELGHGGPIPGDTRENAGPSLFTAEPTLTRGDDQAGHQPLEVPLERARQGLIEVVDVEDQASLRRAEQAEVGQVRVAAQLHSKVRPRAERQVGGHHARRTAVEGERRDQHPSVPDRDELGHPCLSLLLEQGDRIAALGGARHPGLIGEWHDLALRLAQRGARLGRLRRLRTGDRAAAWARGTSDRWAASLLRCAGHRCSMIEWGARRP
jgi:hypothetical protein